MLKKKKKGHLSHHFSPQHMHIENSDITPVTSQHSMFHPVTLLPADTILWCTTNPVPSTPTKSKLYLAISRPLW